jgi:hypothetical protein
VNRRLASSLLVLFFCGAVMVTAQGVPYPPSTLQLTANDTRGSVVTAHSTSTLLTFTVEGDTTGGNFIDVATSDPAVVVSLILPSAIEVTSANAASLGFIFTIVADGGFAGADVPSALSIPGTHTVIQIPGGQLSGVYSIKADATGANADSGMLATYFSSSTVRATATTNAATYKVGDTVILSGLVFDQATPIRGATVNAAVSARLPAAQTSLGNYQLIGQQGGEFEPHRLLVLRNADKHWASRFGGPGRARQLANRGCCLERDARVRGCCGEFVRRQLEHHHHRARSEPVLRSFDSSMECDHARPSSERSTDRLWPVRRG